MADDLFARYGLDCSRRGHKHGDDREWNKGQGVVGRGCKRFGDLVSNRDGTEERGLEIWSQPGMERRTGGGGKRMGDLVSTRDRTEDRVL
jgi:hypothetical protein